MQFPFFSSFAAIRLKCKADENRPLASSRKIQKLVRHTLREEYTDTYPGVLNFPCGCGLMSAVLTSLLVMLACVKLWLHVLFAHPNVHLHKIQLLRLKLGFMALKSRAKWAAPQDKPKNQMKVVLWLGVHLHGNI